MFAAVSYGASSLLMRQPVYTMQHARGAAAVSAVSGQERTAPSTAAAAAGAAVGASVGYGPSEMPYIPNGYGPTELANRARVQYPEDRAAKDEYFDIMPFRTSRKAERGEVPDFRPLVTENEENHGELPGFHPLGAEDEEKNAEALGFRPLGAEDDEEKKAIPGTDDGEESDVPGVKDAKSPAEVTDEAKCETCAKRKYQDGSDDPGVSFKMPTSVDPRVAAAAVRGHEMEHVVRERAKAQQEGRKVVSQSVTYHTGICPECGKFYVSGGTTRTVTAADNTKDFLEQVAERSEKVKLKLNITA